MVAEPGMGGRRRRRTAAPWGAPRRLQIYLALATLDWRTSSIELGEALSIGLKSNFNRIPYNAAV